ncbi:pectinesterase family protein [Paenibacillus sp. FSL M8-0334]|uniref:pectinesterase family protein n=1 Tax=Paenibacillus sp. FSL M8-0334 TaxID=2921623 RepID=UPI0030F91885
MGISNQEGRSIIVAQDGSGHCRTVQEAIDLAPAGSAGNWTVIRIKRGVYKEKVHIDKPFLYLKGEHANDTIITYNDYARKRFPDGSEYKTFNSYTILFGADDIVAEDITFRNDAGRGELVGQALAAYVDGDRVCFRECRFIGHQDTLFTGPLPDKPLQGGSFGGPREGEPRRAVHRQWYDRCYIEGDVDFIFGSATAVFTACDIYSRNRLTEENQANVKLHPHISGWVTAASTPEGRSYGYVFIDCRLIGDAPPESVYLGRPWRNDAKVAYIRCWMGAHIRREGWDNWNKPESEATVTYVEYESSGPGAVSHRRVPWSAQIDEAEAESYALGSVLSEGGSWDWEKRRLT